MGLFFTHPGKTLLFMGGEFAQMHEWKDGEELDWHLLQYPQHNAASRFIKDMNQVVKHHKPLYELDHDPSGFAWIDSQNGDQSVFSFIRYAKDPNDFVVVVLNLTPLVHHNFRLGVPKKGSYVELISSDKDVYGGSNIYNGETMYSEDIPLHNLDQSIQLVLSPLSLTILKLGD